NNALYVSASWFRAMNDMPPIARNAAATKRGGRASVVLVGPRSSQDSTSVGYVDFLRRYQGGVRLSLRVTYRGVAAHFVPADGERKDELRVGDDIFTLEAAAGGSIDFNVKYAFKR
ncbi:MAG TPA: hypothetical protein VJH88_05065, partial [Candidatus Nanoarchaeia archaeon]|nr:hypothetical protein [Candidatus Nanoarchaeia archaeon]